MKKVILSAAALAFGAVAFAQTTPATPPTAPTTVDVPLATDLNGDNGDYGESIQTGDANRVRVRQAGVNQSVYTNQANGSGTGGNLAWTIQTGQVGDTPMNAPGTSGMENAIEVVQKGTENSSYTKQEGDENMAETLQGTNDDASANNVAYIRQGNGQQAQSNEASIIQDGNDNKAHTVQTFDNNDAFTVQNGEGNESDINQRANPNQSAGHYAYVDQDGMDNQSKVDQDGAARQSAETLQLGNDNDARQTQNGSAPGNTALINQGYQTKYDGPTRGTIGQDLLAVDDWTGGGPTGDNSYGATAVQEQTGSNNAGEIAQYGEADGDASGNSASQQQKGDNGAAFIVQNAYGNTDGGRNYAFQIQESGNGNVAGIAQNGEGHKAWQYQEGDMNSALSTQRGEGNKAKTYQMGSNNDVTTAQRGQMNVALVSQTTDGASYIASQNVTDGFMFGSNQIDVVQVGPGVDSFTEPSGLNCEFPDSLTMGNLTLSNAIELAPICTDCD